MRGRDSRELTDGVRESGYANGSAIRELNLAQFARVYTVHCTI
jgi:hypothetical protein